MEVGSETKLNANHVVEWQRAHDHAWRYFALHAGQRLTVFNFFTVLTGLTSAGIAAAMQGDRRFAIVGVALGILLTLLAIVFWKLDQRTAFLTKRAEDVAAQAEVQLLPVGAMIFADEPAALVDAQSGRWIAGRIWTFGSSFRLIFVAAMLFGVTSAAICGLRFTGAIEWQGAGSSHDSSPSLAVCSTASKGQTTSSRRVSGERVDRH